MNGSLLVVEPQPLWERRVLTLTASLHPADVWKGGEEKAAGVEEIRSLIQFAHRTPTGTKKMGIIFQADQLNSQSANALLKILEEPPAYLQLVMLSESLRLLPTIRSRVFLLEGSEDFATMVPNTNRSKWEELKKQLAGFDLSQEEERHQAREWLYILPLIHSGMREDIIWDGLGRRYHLK